MIADDLFSAHARPWLLDHSRELSRIVAPLACLGFAWWVSSATLPAPMWLGLIGYGLAHLALIALRRDRRTTGALALVQGAASPLRLLLDALLALLLVNYSAILGNAIYPLYLLIG